MANGRTNHMHRAEYPYQSFDLRFTARVTILSGAHCGESVEGITTAMSSEAINLEFDFLEFALGNQIEAKIHWPVLFGGVAPMLFVVLGNVTSYKGRRVRVKIRKYEFRVCGQTIHPVAIDQRLQVQGDPRAIH